MIRQIKPRIVFSMDGGIFQSVHCEGMDGDLIQVVILDYDIEGADPENVVKIADAPAYMTITGFEPMGDDVARDVHRAVEKWVAE